MLVENLIRRSPVTVSPRALVSEAALVMKESDVGSVILVDDRDLVGILTDRDIVVGPVADGDVGLAKVDDVMTRNPVCLTAGCDVEECLKKMETHGVRRMPVKNERGELLGVVALDDILMQLSNDLGKAAALIRGEIIGRVRSDR